MGFGLVFRTLRFFHFAHASVITIGAYGFYWCYSFVHAPWFIAAIVGVCLAVLAGLAMEVGVYRNLRGRNASGPVFLLASLGLMVLTQNLISMGFGDVPAVAHVFREAGVLTLLTARITVLQAFSLAVSVGVTGLVALWWTRSKTGMTLRAVGQDPELAAVRGLCMNHVAVVVLGVASALGGLGGILVGLDTNLSPAMGFNALLMGVVVVLMAGKARPFSIILLSLLVALIWHLVGWKLTTQWQSAAVFSFLLAILLLGPQRLRGSDAVA
jgi:branched-chain amino acid transport system permease protein